MKFKENFPGLYRCLYENMRLFRNKEGIFDLNIHPQDPKIHVEEVEKYCLDKQRTRKIIDDMWNSTKERPAIDGNYLNLIKRLGL